MVSKTASLSQTKDARSQPSSHFGDLMWVDYYEEKTQNNPAHRAKQAFIKNRSHRLKRNSRLEILKKSIVGFPDKKPATITHSQTIIHPLKDRHCGEEQKDCKLLIRTSIHAGIAEAFPIFDQKTSESVHHYFTYYRAFVAPGTFPFNSNEMVTWLASEALNQPVLLESISIIGACSQAAKQLLTGASQREVDESTRDIIRLRGRIIKSLRMILQNEVKARMELTIIVVGHLLCLEGAQGNVEALEAHIDGIIALVHACGGMQNLSNNTISVLYYCDLSRWLVKDSPPIFPLCQNWILTIQIESVLFKLRSRSTTLGEDFFSSPWSSELPGALVTLLRSFQLIISYFEDVKDAEVQPLPELTNYLLFVSFHLRSLPYCCTLNPLQESLRMSVLIYSLVRIWTFEGCPGLENIHRIFRVCLEESLAMMEASAPRLLFWMVFMSGFALRGLPSQAWYMDRTRSLAHRLRLRDWKSAERILGGFFFVDRGIGDPARRHWLDIIDHIGDDRLY